VHPLFRSLRLALIRLPKNLRSNRWWIAWNGRLYILWGPKNGHHLAETQSEKLDELNLVPRYVAIGRLWSHRGYVAPHSAGILLTELGMFGNMASRLANSLNHSLYWGIPHVVAPRAIEFSTNLFARGVHQFPGRYTLWFSNNRREAKNSIDVLVRFDSLQASRLKVESDAEGSEQIWKDLHSLISTSIRPNDPALAHDHLVIHLRGGDVFGPRKPRAYGQPPLGYYSLILGHKPWQQVTVVHQDLSNPVLEGIIAECSERELPVSLHSSSIQDDLRVLLRARTLVAGRGTFVPAVAGLSEFVSTVYYFHDKFHLQPPRANLTLVRVVDKHGDYVRSALSHNWENTPEQRQLMLDYPSKHLSFENT
jgi:hypothetical protein